MVRTDDRTSTHQRGLAMIESARSSDETDAPVLEGRDITVHFGGLTALSNVSVEVPKATIVGLIGPNGAGKSTLLGVLSGLLQPQTGRVFLGGVDVTSLSGYKRARRGLARTFQHPELYSGLSVRGHLSLAWRMRFDRRRLWTDLVDGKAWRAPRSEENGRVDDLLTQLGLQQVADAPVTGLPLGTGRLIEVGRALAASPNVVLLDEPLSGLDKFESERLAALIFDIASDEGVSFLLIDHDVDTVLMRSSTVVVLDFGEVIAVGAPAELRKSEVVRSAYFGDEIMAGPEGA
jgi:branched-chain amino acid transport system ATP-binding protein